MREDMSKVINERGLYGRGLRNNKTRLRLRRFNNDLDYEEEMEALADEMPQRISGSRSKFLPRSRKDRMSLLLGPLERFLRTNVGRPWDKVYSEMCEHLDPRKRSGLRVLEQVNHLVATHCYEKNGIVYGKRVSGAQHAPVAGLYVHPRTGILCWREKHIDRPTPRHERTRIGFRSRTYIKLNGIWYVARIRPLASVPETDRAGAQFRDHLSMEWMVLERKQCNSKELKVAGLRNDLRGSAG